MNRRDAAKVIAMAPVAGFFELSAGEATRATDFVRSLVENPVKAQQYAPKFFTPEEWRTVSVLVDMIIPRDAKSGSATDAKVPEYMDFVLTDPEMNLSQNNRTAVRDGLAWFDAESRKRFDGRAFAAVSDAERRQILDDVAWPARARPEMQQGVTFFNRFRDMTASGFFSSQIGWGDVGYIGNVAVQEWKGCPEPALRRLGVTSDVMKTRIPVQNGRD